MNRMRGIDVGGPAFILLHPVEALRLRSLVRLAPEPFDSCSAALLTQPLADDPVADGGAHD